MLRAYFGDSLRRNALFLMAANAITALLGFLYWLVAARLYTTEEIGLAAVLVSVMALLAIVSRLGLDFGLIRFLPQTQEKRELINCCLTLVGLSSVAAAIVFLLGSRLWAPKLLFVREDLSYVAVFLLSTVAMSLVQLQGQSFVALRSAHLALAQILTTGTRLLLVALLTGLGTMGILASWGLAWGVALVVGSLLMMRLDPEYRPLPIIRRDIIRDMAHFSAGNYAAAVLSALPLYVMPLIIIAVLTTEESAYFYVSLGIAGLLGMVVSSTSFSLFAEGSYDQAMLRTQIIKAAKFISLFFCPGLVILFLLGGEILSVFGAEYAQNSTWLLWLFALGWLPHIVNTLYMTTMRVQKKLKPLVCVNSFLAAFIIGVSYLLMSTVGLVGIGIAFLLGQLIVAMVVGPKMLKMGGVSLGGLLSWR